VRHFRPRREQLLVRGLDGLEIREPVVHCGGKSHLGVLKPLTPTLGYQPMFFKIRIKPKILLPKRPKIGP